MRLANALLLLAGSAFLAGCLTTRSDGSARVETTSEANRENNFQIIPRAEVAMAE